MNLFSAIDFAAESGDDRGGNGPDLGVLQWRWLALLGGLMSKSG